MTEQQLVVFGLGNEEFGIDISQVREIVRLQTITAIPQSLDFVEGIVNLVDGVSEILRIPDDSIEPTPPIVASGVSSDFIRGVAKVENRLIIMLDLDRIFTFEEKTALEKNAQ